MRTKALLSALLALVLAGALLIPAGAASAKAKKKSGPVVVGKDAPDDWGSNVEAGIAPIGTPLGQELVEASIGMADKKTVNFIIKTSFLPPSGGVPEFTRYIWEFLVDGDTLELDGKFTNYTRGACDPTSGQCPPPRDPGLQPFFVRGNCGSIGTTVVCEELGIVQASFDSAEATITIPVPLELIGAKPGSEIAGGATDFGAGAVAAATSTYFSAFAAPNDVMVVDQTFTVPGGKKAKK